MLTTLRTLLVYPAAMLLFLGQGCAAQRGEVGTEPTGDGVPTSHAPSPTAPGQPFPTQVILTTNHFIGLVLFACLSYYASIYLCAKAVGESTDEMMAPARYAGSAAGATTSIVGRFISFFRSRGRLAYVPLAPEDGFGHTTARRRAMDIGHGQAHDDDFSAANEPAPTVHH